MTEQGPTVKIHCGTNLVFSHSKQLISSESGGKTAALVSHLKEAQVRVNQFLTELVEKSGSSDQIEGGDEEVSDEDDEEADGEGLSSKVSKIMKRKLEGDISNSDISKPEGKKMKSKS